MSISKAACAIEKASSAIGDAMPRECFPDPDAPRYKAMTDAKNVAVAAIGALTDSVKSQVAGMDEVQMIRVWHSICSLCLHNLEQAVMMYERK